MLVAGVIAGLVLICMALVCYAHLRKQIDTLERKGRAQALELDRFERADKRRIATQITRASAIEHNAAIERRRVEAITATPTRGEAEALAVEAQAFGRSLGE